MTMPGSFKLIALILLVGASPAWADQVRVASITDGDTFRLTTGERIRIAGIDAPETHDDQAHCATEVERGRAATATLAQLIQGREITIERVGRSYNRTVAEVRRGTMDVADEMIRKGAARPWLRRSPKPDWCSLR